MSGIRKSAGLESVTATCGHEVLVVIPPHGMTSRMGAMGKARVAKAAGGICGTCLIEDMLFIPSSGI